MTTRLTQPKRRDFLRLAAFGGAAFASALPGWTYGRDDDFFFVRLSDAHWGFEGPAVNPGATVRVPAQAAEAGNVEFLCDIFCGSGHETMNGVIVVG
ncbi:hypothetical protein P3T23_001722 [Paraburkholderia sp. GAS448]